MMEERICVICGDKFYPITPNNITCSAECSIENKKRSMKRWHRQKDTKPRVEEKNKKSKREANNSLTLFAAEAKAHGMSYCQYVAMQQMKQLR